MGMIYHMKQKIQQPTGDVSEGTLWYNSDLKIEILKMYLTVHKWNGLNMHGQKMLTDGLLSKELQLRTGMPTTRKDGTSPLQQVTFGSMVTRCHIQQSIMVRKTEWVKRDNADQSSTTV